MKRIVEERPFEAKVAIVTAAAIRLVVVPTLQAGAYIAVDLPEPGGRLTGHPLRVTLVKPRAGARDRTVDGLFSKQLEPPELEAVRARLTAVRGTDGWKTSCRAIHVHHEGPWLVTMENVSHSGIGLISDRPFDPGTFLEVELPSIRRSHLRPRLIRVTHARRQAGGVDWLVGGVFLRALTDEELQWLL